MNTTLATIDYVIFIVYFLIVAIYGYWIYQRKKKAVSDTHDYFLAQGSLTWWAIGAALIASNISAEQFVGMSGQGFQMGIGVASYEWMAALTLIIVAVFFMPIYIKNKIFTMPQFLEQRYNSTVAMIMAVFWLLLYVVVNLTSILYLGALAVSTISNIPLYTCMWVMAIFSIFITLGGMKVIGYTSVIQVFFLILGGLATTYISLTLVSDNFFPGQHLGAWKGFQLVQEHAPSYFHMVLKKDWVHTHPNNVFPNYNPYSDLPGMTMLVGGLWITNLNYWGCNQYITQRALGADLQTARKGILFAGFLKLLMPVIVLLPGVAAYVLYREHLSAQAVSIHAGMLVNNVVRQDNAYPVLINLLPAGLKGMSFAALTAAVVASLAGKANSISTIFTLDIYKKIFDKGASEAKLINVGKITIVACMILGVILCPILPFQKGGFQYIQEYTGFVSPGIFAMFILGFFWKKTTPNGALFATIGGFFFSVILKVLPSLVNLSFLYPYGFAAENKATGNYEIPFLDRMGIVFVICVIGMVIISLWDNKRGVQSKGLEIDRKMFFNLSPGFVAGSIIVCGILIALYTLYW